ncbi:MAG: ATP-binding protein [Candidatus Hermodarchaeota archaeon]
MSEKELDIYRELQKHLDKMPIGFPPTSSGVDLKVLKFLYNPEQVELALNLSFIPLPLKKIFRKVKKFGITINELEEKLMQMHKKGLIHSIIKEENGAEVKYFSNAFYLIGIFEFQRNWMTKEYILDFKKYFEEAFFPEEWNKTNIRQTRVIPIEQSIVNMQEIATYDYVRKIIDNVDGPIAIMDCICRKAKELLDDPCKKTKMMETCFTFNQAAESFLEKNLARQINKKEALEILEEIEKEGLVLQPGNAQNPINICCCCGCCCEIMLNEKKFDRPAKFFNSNYLAEVDSELCIGCGICSDRCQMDAMKIIEEKSKVDSDRCIGCGVCIPTCPQEAIKLIKKDTEIIPPKNFLDTYIAIMDKKAELARAEKQ